MRLKRHADSLRDEVLRLRAQQPHLTHAEVGKRLRMTRQAVIGIVRRAGAQGTPTPAKPPAERSAHSRTPRRRVPSLGELLPLESLGRSP